MAERPRGRAARSTQSQRVVRIRTSPSRVAVTLMPSCGHWCQRDVLIAYRIFCLRRAPPDVGAGRGSQHGSTCVSGTRSPLKHAIHSNLTVGINAHSSMSRRRDTTDNSDPSWDSSPISRPTWTKQLAKWLPRVEPTARTLWSKGYIIEKGIVYTLSVRHALDLYHNNVPPQLRTPPTSTSSSRSPP